MQAAELLRSGGDLSFRLPEGSRGTLLSGSGWEGAAVVGGRRLREGFKALSSRHKKERFLRENPLRAQLLVTPRLMQWGKSMDGMEA